MFFPPPPSDNFRGFDRARQLIWCHETRLRVHHYLSGIDVIDNCQIRSVHIESTSWPAVATLEEFDKYGCEIGEHVIPFVSPDEHLPIASEFDHDFTQMNVPAGSDLELAIKADTGWVVDMDALRRYDPIVDRNAVQRDSFVAFLGDMVRTGQVTPSSFDDDTI